MPRVRIKVGGAAPSTAALCWRVRVTWPTESGTASRLTRAMTFTDAHAVLVEHRAAGRAAELVQMGPAVEDDDDGPRPLQQVGMFK